ncbi:putative disease resistance protein RGA3 [Prosopis cineraria]|uniref:putative disease resistance protein RGA3 n=1 Tax=Prosopis cineraria TaxID=364024 RepID=UPI00240F97E3|nr:putative disease resistance protein RGA3 [Prosopis cineraria]
MAESILEVVLGTLNKFIQDELGLFLGVNQEMNRLSSTLSTIWAVLEDAEEKQLTDKAIRNWLQKLKDAAYILDDIWMDECATEGLRFQYRRKNCRSTNKVRHSSLSSFHPMIVLFRYKIARKMKKTRVLLDAIADEKRKFHLCEAVTQRKTEVMEWRQTGSIITQPQVYGREEDKKRIVDFLVGQASGFDDVSVYPIVGIGGLGKTTLAQLVFNDEEITIFKKTSRDASGKKYLIVLDDVWNDDQEKWDRLKYVLSCGSRGSSILVTTRLAKVASIVGTQPSHQLYGLSIDECWKLFRQRAFGPDREAHAQLADIGKEIVKKCGGVPLAAKALGAFYVSPGKRVSGSTSRIANFGVYHKMKTPS